MNARLRMMYAVGPQAESLHSPTPTSTSEDGTLTAEFVVPDVRPGRYTFQASTDRGGGKRIGLATGIDCGADRAVPEDGRIR